MTVLHHNAVYVSALLILVGDVSYASATLRGRVQPNRVTWSLWALAPMIAFTAEIAEGVGLAALMTFMFGLGPLVIFSVSFVNRDAYWRLGRLDLACAVLALTGLVLWLLTQHGVLAITLAIAADGLAAVPTLVKAYRHPGTEHPWAYWCAAVGALLTLLTIDHWDAAHYAFPLYVVIVCATLGSLVTFRLGERPSTRTPTAA